MNATAQKALPKRSKDTTILTLDFTNVLSIPCDGDDGAIRREIDDAINGAVDAVLVRSGTDSYGFPMATEIASGKYVPLRIVVKPPVRETITPDISTERATQMIEGYIRCESLYHKFRDSDDMAQHKVLRGVLSRAIRESIPTASDKSIDAIIEHARMTNTARVAIVGNVEAECQLIASIMSEANEGGGNTTKEPATKSATKAKATQTGKTRKTKSGSTQAELGTKKASASGTKVTGTKRRGTGRAGKNASTKVVTTDVTEESKASEASKVTDAKKVSNETNANAPASAKVSEKVTDAKVTVTQDADDAKPEKASQSKGTKTPVGHRRVVVNTKQATVVTPAESGFYDFDDFE